MNNRQKLIDIVRARNAPRIVVEQQDGTFRFFDSTIRKLIGKTYTKAELNKLKMGGVCLVLDENGANAAATIRGR